MTVGVQPTVGRGSRVTTHAESRLTADGRMMKAAVRGQPVTCDGNTNITENWYYTPNFWSQSQESCFLEKSESGVTFSEKVE